MRPNRSTVLFGVVIALCVAQLGWWCYLLFQESDRIEQAGRLLAAERVEEAARVLGATDVEQLTERARRNRMMFASEGAALGLLVLVGVVLVATAWRRERRLRAEQDRFLAGITHELKTPVATVRLALESLRSGRVPEQRRDDYQDTMLQEIARLERGIQNLLVSAGSGAFGRTLDLRPGDLAEEVEDAMEQVRPAARTAGVELRSTLDPVRVRRDRGAMRMVLHNLLDNAVKYSASGDTVTVELRDVGDSARLTIRDTGQGMTREELERAFDPFYRGTAKDWMGGAGLGLHLVKELIAAQAGNVELRSDGRERGCTVTLEMPVTRKVS